ncbi:MAG: phosphoribosylanthranilate isomerase [Lachnospiraceae bacterium]|nr:phosphoribosylanthranilate isomerase [Lachnospiraceae bacterium]
MIPVKICGLFRKEDVYYVNEAGADYCGFILNYPKSHRYVDFDKALYLRGLLDSRIKPVGVFVNGDIKEIAEIGEKLKLHALQLHGNENEDYIEELKKITDIPVWKAFKIKESKDLPRAYDSKANEILLDAGMGEGKAFDWGLLKDFDREFILAGGLNRESIIKAAALIRPKAFDLSSGVEKDGVKNKVLIAQCVKAAHELV